PALSSSGRASVTSATPSATSYRISAKPIAARASGAEEPDAEIFAGARRGGRRGRGGRRRELLELGRHRAREQAHVPLRLAVVHAGVAEDADEGVVADAAPHVEDLLVALLGRAPDLEVHEILDHLVGAVLRDLLGHLAVVLVAFGLREVVALEVVVVEDGLVVAADVAARHLVGARRVLVAEGPARAHGRWRLRPVDVPVRRAVGVELLGDLGPGLLRDDEDAHPEPRHDRHRLRRDGRGVGPAAEALERRRADRRARLADERAVVFAVARLQAAQQHLRRFHEALAGLVHREPEAVELDAAGATTQAQDQAPIGDVVEHRDSFGAAPVIVCYSGTMATPGELGPFADRRLRFAAALGDALAIIPGAQEARRNGDVNYEFRQSSDFFFLTGFDEPDAVAVVNPAHTKERYVLFVRPRDRELEIWTGHRAGVEGAVATYGADAAYPIDKLDDKLREYLVDRPVVYYRLGQG